jgi:tyrosinase
MKVSLFRFLIISAIACFASAATSCSPDRATTRKEWYVIALIPLICLTEYVRGELSDAEKMDYINAVWCLRNRPSVLPNEEFPGVQDRFDDFVA